MTLDSFVWGDRSMALLGTCDRRLIETAHKVIACTPIDISIVSGRRNEAEQNRLVFQGLSKTPFPDSKHNTFPRSLALDFAPYVDGGIDWKDERAFALVAGVWMSCAKSLGYRLRWGGDWDGDGSTMDQSFTDIGHLELVV